MSVESDIGARVLQLRDLVKDRIVTVLVEQNVNLNLNLSNEQLKELQGHVNRCVEQSFDNGLSNVLSVVHPR